MSKESYIRGFCKAAEAHGVDPQALAKFAQQKTVLRPRNAQQASDNAQQASDVARVARDVTKIVAEKNPHGVIDTAASFRDKTKTPTQVGAIALGSYMKPFWDPEAGALNTTGTNMVNRISKATPPHFSPSPEMVNNLLRPMIDQNGEITPYGTNQIDKVIENAPALAKYLRVYNR